MIPSSTSFDVSKSSCASSAFLLTPSTCEQHRTLHPPGANFNVFFPPTGSLRRVNSFQRRPLVARSNVTTSFSNPAYQHSSPRRFKSFGVTMPDNYWTCSVGVPHRILKVQSRIREAWRDESMRRRTHGGWGTGRGSRVASSGQTVAARGNARDGQVGWRAGDAGLRPHIDTMTVNRMVSCKELECVRC